MKTQLITILKAMVIEKGSDYIIRLDCRDDKGNRIRVATKPSFYVKVFTADKKNYLLYKKEQIKCTADYDTLYISDKELASLESGVIAYTYGWGVSDSNFEDMEYNRSLTKYTDDYFRNDAPTPITPANPSIEGNSYPPYVGYLYTKDLPTLTMSSEYIKSLMAEGRATIGKVMDDIVRWDASVADSDDEKSIFILVPANYPELFVMDATTLQFTIGAFTIYNNILMDFDGNGIGYTLYVYKLPLYRFSARIKFGFKENIEEWVNEHPNQCLNLTSSAN